eukprot:CAMPEP_0119275684 /NCGR_PEP_ID=MMETSP1329-20130426/14212_1 /TAXON_ID=114041 /ORGANISM="Genus nov. species nov., Strain RCC1024" /LENGTH=77 /DNA_ID=CAMNT_0007276087 /DNA_START=205 /DNA_END=434 /DNA_ORIENTATION=-
MPNSKGLFGFGKKKKKEDKKASRFACAFGASLVERSALSLAEALTEQADSVEEWGEVVVGWPSAVVDRVLPRLPART